MTTPGAERWSGSMFGRGEREELIGPDLKVYSHARPCSILEALIKGYKGIHTSLPTKHQVARGLGMFPSAQLVDTGICKSRFKP